MNSELARTGKNPETAEQTPDHGGTPPPVSPLERPIKEALARGNVSRATTLALELYGQEVLGWLAACMGDPTAAGDVYADFSLRLFLNIGQFRWQSSLRTWVYAVARSVRTDHQRRRENRPNHWRSLSQVPREVSRLVVQIRQSTLAYLKTEVKSAFVRLRQEVLDEDQQAILILRVNREMSWDEVAIVMEARGMSAAALQTAAARYRKRFGAIKKKLRREAEDRGLIPPKKTEP